MAWLSSAACLHLLSDGRATAPLYGLLSHTHCLRLHWTCKFKSCIGAARTLDGDTNQARRQAHIDDFNNSPSVFIFLITTGAGGVGINLTAANKWVLHAGAL